MNIQQIIILHMANHLFIAQKRYTQIHRFKSDSDIQ